MLPASYGCRSAGCRRARAGETLFEIPDQIVDGLCADREANRTRSHSGGLQLVVVQLSMRRTRRVNDQALRVADVRQVRPQRDTANEILTGLAAAAAIEREDGTRSTRQVFVHE